MKYFIVEGVIKNQALMNENILKEHIAYSTQNAVNPGFILVSGVKEDKSAGILLMKAESLEKLEAYLASDPLKTSGVQDYHVIEFTPHYHHQAADEWFEK